MESPDMRRDSHSPSESTRMQRVPVDRGADWTGPPGPGQGQGSGHHSCEQSPGGADAGGTDPQPPQEVGSHLGGQGWGAEP